ncbi:MAG: CDP-diacylglycerol--glycerol-3-phosphate 3-phosphatidyltransferase [Clostridia bacterium]|nr:CDP-diacylglycerol--glycerol-3-phosphate 3-phosphatidyltransferase [Clostridia bacterium]
MNTANKITILRIILVPIFMALMLIGNDAARMWALAIFIIASISDWLDGYIARNYNQVSNFGKFMDPLADKILTTAAFMALMEIGRLWFGSVAIMLILTREFMVAGLRMNASTNGTVIAASMFGKVKTVVQMIAIIASIALTHSVFPQETSILMTNIFVWASTVVTVVSGIDYLWKNRQVFLK